MTTTMWWLGLTFGTLSVVMLVTNWSDYGLVVPLQIMLDYYEQAMKVLFGWAEPWIEERLTSLGEWAGAKLDLYPHWKHVVTLFALYVGAQNREVWYVANNIQGIIPVGEGAPPEVRFGYGRAIYYTLWGALCALATGIAAGTVPLTSAENGVLVVAITMVGLAGRDVGLIPWNALTYYVQHLLRRWWKVPSSYWDLFWNEVVPQVDWATPAMGLAVCVALRFAVPEMSGVLVLVILLLVVASLHIIRALRWMYVWRFAYPNKTLWQLLNYTSPGRMGLGIAGTILGAFGFLAANSGLQALGL